MERQVKLQAKDVRKTYGSVVALEGTSIDLLEGEFLTLLGPSGSGKTTLLMAIAGLNDPDSGEIWIDGELMTYTPLLSTRIRHGFSELRTFSAPHDLREHRISVKNEKDAKS